MKNKILSILVIAVMIVAVSCGTKSQENAETSGTDTTAVASDSTVVKSDSTSVVESTQDTVKSK